ncbi:HAD family hydrolase [Phocaeicola paurosaccharolyticus]|uniref:HAD family hydrolase n=1 Tax=Phocaeicola paurosaccharolyticus TaxID=732242 RepID=UPI00046A5AE5|nr:HAD family hydrolase [Phocaeicola paurosaccharolyticus]
MNNIEVKGIIFDFGGTIDTNSIHWAEVLWRYYKECKAPVEYQDFRDAYVFAERALAKYPYIQPYHNFLDLLKIKVNLELEYLLTEHIIDMDVIELQQLAINIAEGCYGFVLDVLAVTRPIIDELSHRYPLVLVSNFYGNIETILADFKLDSYFKSIVESSVVGVRKPDPAIYQLGVDAIGLKVDEVLVVGDSFSKDVVPAKKVGCKVVWLQGKGWGNEEIDNSLPDFIITDFKQLSAILLEK